MLKEHLDICREEDDTNILQLRLENYESEEDEEEKDNSSDCVNNSNAEGMCNMHNFVKPMLEENLDDESNCFR